ncbi:MAG: GGDEF domain-containing protein [Acinetobacter sp.]
MKRTFFQSIKAKLLNIVPQGMMMNWSAFDKSLLILLLSGLDQIVWLVWCIYSYITPEVREWIRPDYMLQRIVEISITIAATFICLVGLYKFRHIKLLNQIAPLTVISVFTVIYIHAAFSIGITSPTTIGGYISIVSLGCLFIKRKYIYIVIFPSTVVLLYLIYLSATNQIEYAPVFSEKLNTSNIYKNTYWVGSMAFLYFPIFFMCTSLFEILLNQWRNREQEIKIISEKDGLTNVYNRRSISEKLSMLDKHQLSYSIVLLDLDHFKTINDSYGHDIGDRVLRRVASILAQNIRHRDMVGRFGGEEFILILNEDNLSVVKEVAERCRHQIEKTEVQVHNDLCISITASLGIAIGNQEDSHENIVRLADQALYLAKSRGRNQVRHHLEIV